MENIVKVFEDTRRTIADAFDGISFEKTDAGFLFTWDNCPVLGTNIAVLYQGKVSEQLVSWIRQGSSRELWTKEDVQIDEENQFTFHGIVGMYYRKPQKTKPILVDQYNFKKYSYNIKNIKQNLRTVATQLVHLFEFDAAQAFELERYIGAALHLNNGEILTIEDFEGNIHAALLVSNIDKQTIMVEFIITRKNLRRQGFGRKLLNYLVSENQDKELFGIFVDENQIKNFFSSEKFEITDSFHIYNARR